MALTLIPLFQPHFSNGCNCDDTPQDFGQCEPYCRYDFGNGQSTYTCEYLEIFSPYYGTNPDHAMNDSICDMYVSAANGDVNGIDDGTLAIEGEGSRCVRSGSRPFDPDLLPSYHPRCFCGPWWYDV